MEDEPRFNVASDMCTEKPKNKKKEEAKTAAAELRVKAKEEATAAEEAVKVELVMHADTQGLISGTEAACLAELHGTLASLKVYIRFEKLAQEAPRVTWWKVGEMEETLIEPDDLEWNGEVCICIRAGLTEEDEILGAKDRGGVLQGRQMQD